MKKTNILTTLGANGLEDREDNDFYATEPKATELLLELETFDKNILEPCCGKGHISEVLKENGYNVYSSDLIDRGYGEVKDFFEYKEFNGDIITNPPYKIAQQIIEHGLSIAKDGQKLALFLKLTFLESQARKKIFSENPPKTIYISSSRLICAKGGDFEKYTGSAVAYCWYIWEKGYKGNTTLKWFN